MTTLHKAAQQALEALEKYRQMMFAEAGCRWDAGDAAITALRAALAQQAEPAPGWCKHCKQYSIEEPLPAQQAEPDAYGYAARLAVAIWEEHYKDTAPQWKPLDYLIGVLTQIGNMTSGLTRQAQQAEPVQEPVAKVELMTTGGNAGLATRIVEIDDHLRERLRPGQLLYTAPPRCPSCASLEAQNTELDRKLAELERADPAQEPVARECSDPMCACRGGPCAECEEGRREKEIEDLRFRLDFYQRRCEALQSWQSKMRDPERTIVCDILANGFTLDPAFAGDRYTAPPQRKPLTDEEIERHIGYRLPEYAMRLLLELVNERAHGIGGDDGQA